MLIVTLIRLAGSGIVRGMDPRIKIASFDRNEFFAVARPGVHFVGRHDKCGGIGSADGRAVGRFARGGNSTRQVRQRQQLTEVCKRARTTRERRASGIAGRRSAHRSESDVRSETVGAVLAAATDGGHYDRIGTRCEHSLRTGRDRRRQRAASWAEPSNRERSIESGASTTPIAEAWAINSAAVGYAIAAAAITTMTRNQHPGPGSNRQIKPAGQKHQCQSRRQ